MNGNLWRACVLGVTGVLAVGLLGACGGDDEAAPKPKFSSSSPAPTASSSSPVVESSSAAPETPEAFVRRWVTLQTQMQNQGNSADFRSISTTCAACIGLADLVDSYYAAGGFVKTRGWAIKSLNCQENQSKVYCTARIVNATTSYKESSSSPQKVLQGGPFMEIFEAALTQDTWNMTRIAEQAS